MSMDDLFFSYAEKTEKQISRLNKVEFSFDENFKMNTVHAYHSNIMNVLWFDAKIRKVCAKCTFEVRSNFQAFVVLFWWPLDRSRKNSHRMAPNSFA